MVKLPGRRSCPPVAGQESTKDKTVSLYLSQRCWGRSCLHLAAMRAGHWRSHLAGIGREIHFTRPLTRKALASAGGRV